MWSPSQPNGWWPKWSPDGRRLLYGNGCVWVMDFVRNRETCVTPIGWHYGWLDAETLLYGTEAPNDTAIQHRVTFADDGTFTDVLTDCPPELAAGNTLDACQGHWATSLAKTARVCRDGVVVGEGVTGGGGVSLSPTGTLLVSAHLGPGETDADYGLRVYLLDGGRVDMVTPHPANWARIGARDIITIVGKNRSSYRLNGEWLDCDITPWRGGSGAPLVLDVQGDLWFWTFIWSEQEQRAYVAGWRPGETEPLLIPDLPSISLSVVYDAGTDQFQVAGCSDVGKLLATRIARTAARQAIPWTPPPPPMISFTLDPVPGPAPCVVNARLVTYQSIAQHRWLWGKQGANTLNISLPVNGERHDYVITESGSYDFAIRAQGTNGVVLTTDRQSRFVPPAPPEEKFRLGVVCWAEQEQPETYERLAEFGWTAVRLVTEHVPDDRLAAAVAVPEAAGLRVVVLRSPERVVAVPDDHDWEPFNEPDGGPDGSVSAADVIRRVLAQLPTIRAKGLRVWLPAIMNPGAGNLAYMRTVLAGVPADFGADLHRYPQDRDTPPSQPRKGYSSRSAEMTAIKSAIGTRPFIVTEGGYAPGVDRHGWWLFGHVHRCTEAQQLTWEREEAAIWRKAGATLWCHYQMNGGSGLRRDDGTWRPVATMPTL